MNSDEPVGKGTDSSRQRGVRGRGGSVSAGLDAGVESLEKGERRRGYVEGALAVPYRERIVELLSNGLKKELRSKFGLSC